MITIKTRMGNGNTATTVVRTSPERDENITVEDIRKELSFIDGKLARAGTAPAQLTTRRYELETLLAALKE